MALRLTAYQAKIALLRCFAGHPDHQYRTNVLGRANYPGALERQLELTFTTAERALAGRALRQLENDDLIRPTGRDTMAPDDWLEITAAGRSALERGTLDSLDHLLDKLDPVLINMRHGAWAAVESFQPDAMRQGAHSGRELIRQVLDRTAPDEAVRRAAWFKKGERITRSDRIRLTMERRQGRFSESTSRVIEAQVEVVEANYARLSALAHAEGEVIREHVSEILRAAESALKDLLREESSG